MTAAPWNHLALLGGEVCLVAFVVVALLYARRWIGLTPLFIFLGSNQYLQTILVSTLEVPLPGGTSASPGSIVLFGGSLFAVLLVYMRESVASTRSMIVGIVLANVTLTLLSAVTAFQVGLGGTENRLGIPVELFQLNARIFLSGTAVLILDCILVVVLYEGLASRARRVPLVLRTWVVLAGVLAVDTVLFTLLSFGADALPGVGPAVAWKCAAGTLYTGLLMAALWGTEERETRDVWSIIQWQQTMQKLEYAHRAQLVELIDELQEARDELETRVEQRTAELADSEARYRRLLDLSPEAVLLESDGEVVLTNEAATELLGELRSRSVRERVLAGQRDAYDAFDGSLKDDEAHRQVFHMLDADDAELEVQVSGRTVPGGRILVLRDVSRERHLDRLKDEFVATVNHEIRTPLTSVKGSLDLLLAGVGDPSPEARNLIDIGSRNVQRLIRLVNDLLDLQKIEAGLMPFRFERRDLEPLLRDAAAGVQALAEGKGIPLQLDLTGIEAEVDPDRLQQVVTNLLSNAIHHSPEGSEVILRLRTDDEVHIEVQDHGPGISADDRDRIFERFAQAGGQHRAGGTGLGLAISSSLASRMGGRIELDSEVGVGSTFRLVLPRG